MKIDTRDECRARALRQAILRPKMFRGPHSWLAGDSVFAGGIQLEWTDDHPRLDVHGLGFTVGAGADDPRTLRAGRHEQTVRLRLRERSEYLGPVAHDSIGICELHSVGESVADGVAQMPQSPLHVGNIAIRGDVLVA